MSAPLMSDPAQRVRWDSSVLTLFRTGDSESLRTLHDLCLALGGGPGPQDALVFWRQCVTFFELVALNPGLPGTTVKRIVSRILLQYVMLSRDQGTVSEALAKELEQFCTRHNTFLEEADEGSQRLETELGAWAREPHLPLPASTRDLAQALAVQARGVGFDALADMAQQLARVLPLAEQCDSDIAMQAQVLLAAAEHLRQLLHQWAAGISKPANEQLQQALAEMLPE